MLHAFSHAWSSVTSSVLTEIKENEMKLKSACMAVGSALALVSTAASAYTVGGINFGSNAAMSHFENTTVYESVVNQPGDILTGYGLVTSVNSIGNYGMGQYSLYFEFQYTVDSITSQVVQFSSGTMNIYRLAQDALDLTNLTPSAAKTAIEAGTKWVQFTGHDNVALATPLGASISSTTQLFGEGSVIGAALSFSGRGLADVVAGWGMADVEYALDTSKQPDVAGGFADVELSSTGTSTGTAPGAQCIPIRLDSGQVILPTGEFCISGSTNIKGNFIPEPSGLALVGLGLLGAGIIRRRKPQA